MAEAIGVVSGALTFATVAAQVTKSIIEIRDCWGQIRDAPEDLQRLVKEVEIFGFILADIEADLSQDLVASALKNSNHASQSLELCKQAASDLEAVSTSLKNDISNTKGIKRTYTSVKVVIKKGNIEKYRSRLGSATRLLSLSQQCYTRALLQLQPELIAARILQSGENAAGQQVSQDKENTADNDINTITKPRYKSKPRHSQKEDYLWRLVLPPWLAGKCFEVVRRAPHGWQWNFKTYNILPLYSKVFDLVRSNNVEGLQQLFSSGQASPFDSNSSGETLIEMACFFNNVEMVDFLISQGANVEGWSRHIGEWLHIWHMVYSTSSTFRSLSHLPLLRTLQKQDDELYAMDDDLAWECLKSASQSSAEQFSFLQRNACPLFYEAPQWKRNIVLKTSLKHLRSADFDLRDAYGIICTILRGVSLTACPPQFESYSKFLGSYGLRNFPRILAKHHGNRLRMKRLPVFSIEGFEKDRRPLWEILNDFLVGGFDINEVDDMGSHFFIDFCGGYLDRCHRIWSNVYSDSKIRWWLKELQNIGVNLKSFGKSAERSFKLSGGPREYDPGYPFHGATLRLLGFSYGNSPEDWTLWLSEPSDAFSGDFWRMIERRMEIPGGWSSDIHLFLQ